MLSMNGISCIRNLSRRREYEVFADNRSMPGIAEWSVNTLKGEPSRYWRRRPTAQARQAISNSEASYRLSYGKVAHEMYRMGLSSPCPGFGGFAR